MFDIVVAGVLLVLAAPVAADEIDMANAAYQRGGIEPNEVELIELGLPEMVAALGNKAIDGATLLEPFITFATAGVEPERSEKS